MIQEKRTQDAPRSTANPEEELSQILSDVEGLEKLQVMQLKLIREVSRRLKRITQDKSL